MPSSAPVYRPPRPSLLLRPQQNTSTSSENRKSVLLYCYTLSCYAIYPPPAIYTVPPFLPPPRTTNSHHMDMFCLSVSSISPPYKRPQLPRSTSPANVSPSPHPGHLSTCIYIRLGHGIETFHISHKYPCPSPPPPLPPSPLPVFATWMLPELRPDPIITQTTEPQTMHEILCRVFPRLQRSFSCPCY